MIETPRLSREEIAQRDIGRTDISPGVAKLLSIAFLLTLLIPPVVQLVYDLTRNTHDTFPSSLTLFRTFPKPDEVDGSKGASNWSRIVYFNDQILKHIELYEQQLEDRSVLTQYLLGPTQQVLTRFTGLGNEQVYIGRNGWLFYRPDVDYLTGPGFLDPHVIARREKQASSTADMLQVDPRPAILEFHHQLAARNIQLVLMPVPGKSAIYPEQLTGRFHNVTEPLTNRSFADFKTQMEAAGILLFDPAPHLMQQKQYGPQYLKTDTHWTPPGMQFVTAQLAQYIQQHCHLSPGSQHSSSRTQTISNLGDIAAMLHLPSHQTLFAPEQVTLRLVSDTDGKERRTDLQSEILLLGDSFTNIYSLAELNWGKSAGFAEQLGLELHQTIDCIAQNAGGSHAVRQALVRQLAGGNDRLAGKRVVIWEFAARELAFGDWKRLPLPKQAKASHLTPTSQGETTEIMGTIAAIAGVPQPGSVPYRDAITAIHLKDVESLKGETIASEIVVYLWGLRDNRLTPAARWRAGSRVTLHVTPWDAVQNRYGRFNRIELDDPDLKLVELPTWWCEEQQ